MSGWFSDNRRWLAFAAILLLAVLLRWLAFSLFDSIHHDEILQYQERAYRIVFGRGIEPWETRYGARSALIAELLAGPMALAALVTSDHWPPVIAARTLFALLCLGAVPAAYALGSLASRRHALVAMFAAAVWYESVLFGVHVLSESIAAAAAAGGTAALLRAAGNRQAALLAGFLLALSVLLRLQYAVFAGVLVLWQARLDWAQWRRLAIGALPALAIGAASDLAAGMTPFSWAVANFTANVNQGRASYFGTEGPFWYLWAINLRLGVLAGVILVMALLSGPRYRGVLAAALVTVAVHSLIPHKEYRFVWLPVFLIVTLAAIGSVELLQRLRPRTAPHGSATTVLCLAWGAVSLATYWQTGGAAIMRDGAPLVRAALRAEAMPGTCGIGMAFVERKPVAQVFLPRPVALYLFPDPMNTGARRFDPVLTEAVDALIVTGKGRPPPPYRQISCERERDRDVCLWRRAGGCRSVEAARGYTYQEMLLRDDL